MAVACVNKDLDDLLWDQENKMTSDLKQNEMSVYS
jgi:hypothetical protein